MWLHDAQWILIELLRGSPKDGPSIEIAYRVAWDESIPLAYGFKAGRFGSYAAAWFSARPRPVESIGLTLMAGQLAGDVSLLAAGAGNPVPPVPGVLPRKASGWRPLQASPPGLFSLVFLMRRAMAGLGLCGSPIKSRRPLFTNHSSTSQPGGRNSSIAANRVPGQGGFFRRKHCTATVSRSSVTRYNYDYIYLNQEKLL